MSDKLSRQLAPVLELIDSPWTALETLTYQQLRMWAKLQRLSRRANRKILKVGKAHQKKAV